MRKILLSILGFTLILSVGAQTNLVQNGGFETGDRSGWNTFNNGIQNTDVYEGSFAGFIEAAKQGSFLIASFTVVPGKTYEISFAAKWPDGHGTAPGINMEIQDQAKVPIGATAYITATEWTVETAQVTIPDGISDVRVAIYKQISPICYVDDVIITEVSGENPTPDIILSDDGEILEDFEDGEVITISMTNDTFVDPITPANWTVTNLPAGVSVGSVTRVNDTEVALTLSGNTTGDYDVDITDMTVEIASAEFTNYEFPVIVNTGITFIAAVEGGQEVIWEEDFSAFTPNVLLDSAYLAGVGFTTEGDPDSVKVISGYLAMYTLKGNNYFLTSLELTPGVSYIYSVDLKTADGSKTNGMVRDATASAIQTAGVESTDWVTTTAQFRVDPDKDTVTLGVYKWGPLKEVNIDNMKLFMITEPRIEVTDDGEILEGSEDGEVLSVKVLFDTFVAAPDIANWSADVLPDGVSLGSLSRIDDTTIEITLSGNATTEYNGDIATSLTATRDEFVISNKSLTAISIVFTAIDEAPVLTISDDGEILEGAEDGEVITASLTSDTFVASLTPVNWIFANLPAGVSLGSAARIDDQTVELTLSGNSTGDYDVDITDVSLTVKSSELTSYEEDLTATTGVTFTAVVEVASITMTDDGEILEGAEDGEVITVMLDQASFEASLTPSNWTFSNLPAGVSLGSATRIDDQTVELTLSGNSSEDYDSDINNVELSVAAAEIAFWDSDLTATTGVTFTAVIESGIGDLYIKGLTIFPNPVKDQMILSADDMIRSIMIFDLLGNKVFEIVNLNANDVELPVSHWNEGVYILNIIGDNDKRSTTKIVK